MISPENRGEHLDCDWLKFSHSLEPKAKADVQLTFCEKIRWTLLLQGIQKLNLSRCDSRPALQCRSRNHATGSYLSGWPDAVTRMCWSSDAA